MPARRLTANSYAPATIAVTVGNWPPAPVKFALTPITGPVAMPNFEPALPAFVARLSMVKKLMPSNVPSRFTLDPVVDVVAVMYIETYAFGSSNVITDPGPYAVTAFNDVPISAISFSLLQRYRSHCDVQRGIGGLIDGSQHDA